MAQNKTLFDSIPLLITISLICFLSYNTIVQVVIPFRSWSTGVINISLAIIVIWSLLATKFSDPGYVHTTLYSSECTKTGRDLEE